jgi:flavin reductase (DIM6/NTAB) family NADH-FMN oxidoreductase RutF
MSRSDADPAEFRQLLGRFATGVTVITLFLPDGRPAGMTASSLASVSLEPPLLSTCIDHGAELYETLCAARGYAINVLAASQEAVSRRFATGHPILDGVLAWIDCEQHAAYPGGDHTILVGHVLRGGTTDAAPLIYFRGGYTGLAHG